MRNIILSISFMLMGSFIFEEQAHGQSCKLLQNMLNQRHILTVDSALIKRGRIAAKQQGKLLVKIKSDMRRHGCEKQIKSDTCAQLKQSSQNIKANLAHIKQALIHKNAPWDAVSAQTIAREMVDKECASQSFVTLKPSIAIKNLAQGVQIYGGETTTIASPNPSDQKTTQVDAMAKAKPLTNFAHQEIDPIASQRTTARSVRQVGPTFLPDKEINFKQ